MVTNKESTEAPEHQGQPLSILPLRMCAKGSGHRRARTIQAKCRARSVRPAREDRLFDAPPAKEVGGCDNYGDMRRLLTILPFLAACGTEPDSRPVTLEAVVFEVLAPTCGQVQCHSTSTHTEGYALDTLDAARSSMSRKSDRDKLLREMEEGSMPPDAPLDDRDLALFKAWIDAGAPGL